MKHENGHYTQNFIFWAKKIGHLEDRQYQRGMRLVESMVKDAARTNEVLWPPTYAEFLGYCEFVAPEHQVRKPPALPDKSAQERAKVVGRQTLDALRAMEF